jgi:hypothetical protein
LRLDFCWAEAFDEHGVGDEVAESKTREENFGEVFEADDAGLSVEGEEGADKGFEERFGAEG